MFTFWPDCINICRHRNYDLEIIALATDYSLNFCSFDLLQSWESIVKDFLKSLERLFVVFSAPFASPLSSNGVERYIFGDVNLLRNCNLFVGESRGLGLLVGEWKPLSLRLALTRLVCWGHKVDRVIAWLEDLSWPHLPCLLWHVCICRLVDALVLLFWSLDKSLLNCSTDGSSRGFAEGLTKGIFSLDLRDIALIAWNVESVVLLPVTLVILFVLELGFVSSVTRDLFSVIVFH